MGVEFAPGAPGVPARRWETYPDYKDSGVEWVGKIPAHWDIKKLKRIFRVINGSTPKSGVSDYWDGDIVWVTPDDLGQLKSDTINESGRRITKLGYQSCGTTLIPSGSLVLSTRAPIGHLAIAGIDLCTNQGCKVVVFKSNDDTRFFYYQLLTTRSELKSWGQGSTFKELGKDKLEAVELVSPTISEQRAIAAFLDRKTAHIDTLISKKERLITLLQEKRAALISHTVTKGLDHDVPMKDSGVEWLGEIPAHWKVIKLKYAFILMRGFDLVSDKFLNGRFPVYASNGIIGYHNQYTTIGPSVTVGRSGSVGEVKYIESNFWAHNTSLYVKSFKQTHPKFTFYYLKALDLKSLSAGSAVGTLNRNYIHELTISIPNYSEQEAISSFLDYKTDKIDTLIPKIQETIEKLQEYRTALISAAVIGKIDVRNENRN